MIDRIQMIREAHAKVLKDKDSGEMQTFGFVYANIPATEEDVLDEAQHLDALDHVEVIDVDADENEVDMDAVSPEMREQFKDGEYVNQWVG